MSPMFPGKRENGTTEIAFTIPLKSGDPRDREITPDGDTTVLLAYGAGNDSFFNQASVPYKVKGQSFHR